MHFISLRKKDHYKLNICFNWSVQVLNKHICVRIHQCNFEESISSGSELKHSQSLCDPSWVWRMSAVFHQSRTTALDPLWALDKYRGKFTFSLYKKVPYRIHISFDYQSRMTAFQQTSISTSYQPLSGYLTIDFQA